eukprot:scaffold92148_cov24-Attheya_sp.AAC.1
MASMSINLSIRSSKSKGSHTITINLDDGANAGQSESVLPAIAISVGKCTQKITRQQWWLNIWICQPLPTLATRNISCKFREVLFPLRPSLLKEGYN